MKNKKIFIIGGMLALMTILIFLIGIQNGKRAIDYVALIFTLTGELIFVVTQLYFNGATMLSNMAVSSITIVYLITNIVFSAIFKNTFENNIIAFTIIHLILICVYALVLFLSGLIINKSNADEKRLVTQKAVIDECERIANILANNSKYEKHKECLTKIYENIKYGDHISDYKSNEILSALNSIKSCDNDDDIDNKCNLAIQLIEDRNITVSQLKRGGF